MILYWYTWLIVIYTTISALGDSSISIITQDIRRFRLILVILPISGRALGVW